MTESVKPSGVSTSRKIVRNTVFSSLSELSIGFHFVFFILAARYLGNVRYGQFADAIAFVGLFTLLVYFGFSYSIVKVILQDKEQTGRCVGNALIIQATFAVLCFAACYVVAVALRNKYPPEFRLAIAVIFVAESLRCFGFTLRAACKALGAFHWDTVAVYAERVFLVAAGAIVLLTGRGLLAVSGVYLFSRLISVVVLVTAMTRLGHSLSWKPDLSAMKMLVRRSAIYVFQSACWRMYDVLDVALLGVMVPFGQVGWYSAGRRILEGLYLVPNFVTEVTYPEIHARRLVSRKLIIPVFDKALKHLFAVSVIAALSMAAIAPFLVSALFGSAYEQTVRVILILSTAVIPAYCLYLFGNTLIAIDRQRTELAISASRGAFNLAAYIWLISRWGYLGAAAAMSVSNWLVIGFYVAVLKGEGLARLDQLRFLWQPVLAGVLLIPLYFLHLPSLVLFFLLIFLYFICLLCFRFFEASEVALFRDFVAGRIKGLKR
jgi:O-antigen/teichoic acid export membrane protein